MKITTNGIATSISCSCVPADKRRNRHECSVTSHCCHDEHDEHDDKKKPQHMSYHDYSANQLFMIGLLNNGLGYHDSLALCGYLGLKRPWSSNACKRTEKKVISNMLNDISNIIKKISRKKLL